LVQPRYSFVSLSSNLTSRAVTPISNGLCQFDFIQLLRAVLGQLDDAGGLPLRDGQVVDVEYLMGESMAPQWSDRLDPTA